MTANSSNSNDSTFVTPNPEVLQSKETQAEIQKRVQAQADSADRNPDVPSHVSEAATNQRTTDFNPDDISQSGDDAAVSETDRAADDTFNRQMGSAFRSSS